MKLINNWILHMFTKVDVEHVKFDAEHEKVS